MVIGINLISAYNLLCLKKGETIKFSECNPLMKNYYCNSDISCNYCVFVGSNGKYCPANMNHCNAIGLACSNLGDGSGTTIDRVPPVISMCFPINGTISPSSKQYIKCSADKASDWYYQDSSSMGDWKKLCDNVVSCDKSVSFSEGAHSITVKAVDKYGNEGTIGRSFSIDSQKPKIYKTLPKKGFSDGKFSVEFKEANPKSLILYYGTKTKAFDLNQLSSKCSESNSGSSGKTVCEIEADVAEFDGQTIQYWFELTDVADSIASSKKISVQVDNTAPKLLNPDNFWTQGTGKSNKYIYVSMLVEENNLDYVKYSDSLGSSTLKTVCSTLKSGGKCEKKLTFTKKGVHDVEFVLMDEAGHATTKTISFTVA